MSSTLQVYRALIPAHAAVPDPTVETWLVLAARRHTAAAFGSVFTEAMVMWVAAHLDPMVQAGQAGELGDVCAAPVASKKGKVDPESAYWKWYLDYRDSRASGAPTWVPPWP